jgi:hypothetical protein
MARQRTSVFEDIMEITARLPWWVGVVLALVLYVWLHSVASQPIPAMTGDPKQMGDFVGKQLGRTFALYLQYILPICCLLGAGVSAYRQHRSKAGGELGKPAARRSFGRAPGTTQPQPAHSASETACPMCGAPMVKRRAKKGASAGQEFWGCSGYPQCRGTRSI